MIINKLNGVSSCIITNYTQLCIIQYLFHALTYKYVYKCDTLGYEIKHISRGAKYMNQQSELAGYVLNSRSQVRISPKNTLNLCCNKIDVSNWRQNNTQINNKFRTRRSQDRFRGDEGPK